MVKFKCAQRNTKNVKALELRAFMPPGNSLGAGSSRKNYRITTLAYAPGEGSYFRNFPTPRPLPYSESTPTNSATQKRTCGTFR